MNIIREKEAVYSDKGNGSSLAEFAGRTAAARRSGYGIAKTRLAAGAFETKHHHAATEEAYLFIKGKCLIRIGGRDETLSAGDLLLVEPGEEHEIVEALEDTEFWALTVPAFDPGDYIV